MKHGADWYQREPVAYLGGVQGLTAKEHAVYSVVLDLIYLHGGSVNNDPAWIAGWISDMGSHAVRKAINSLVERGKLAIEGDQITQKRAKTQAKTKENVRETRRESGKKGGKRSGESRRQSKENNNISEASASTREEERREEVKEEPIGSSKSEPTLFAVPDPPKPKRKPKRAHSLPDGWVPSDKNLSDAQKHGLSPEEISHEAEQFRNHHQARGNAFKDWDAAWRTWLGNVGRFGNRSVSQRAASGGYGRGSSFASVVAGRAARHQD